MYIFLLAFFIPLFLYLLRIYTRSKYGVVKSRVRLNGYTCIVTGGNTGLGYETAIDLAKRQCRVIIACRDQIKMEEAIIQIKKISGSENVVGKLLDLSSFDSIHNFCKDINQTEKKINILINNSGVMALHSRQETENKLEMQMGVNHFGHFLLTNLLLDKIKASAPARIINVSSYAHVFASTFNFDDINSEKSYSPFLAYAQSKLANILMMNELSKKLEGTNVNCYSLHPGTCLTDLGRNLWPAIRTFALTFRPLIALFLKDAKEGAQTTIFAAVDPSLDKVTNVYLEDCAISKASKTACDDGVAKKLWEVSETITGLSK